MTMAVLLVGSLVVVIILEPEESYSTTTFALHEVENDVTEFHHTRNQR